MDDISYSNYMNAALPKKNDGRRLQSSNIMARNRYTAATTRA